MKKLVLLAILYSPIVLSQQTSKNMMVGSLNRNYLQYLPIGFNPSTESLPVIFAFHGLGSDALQTSTAGFNFIADTARFIVIYPNGTLNTNGQQSWNNGVGFASTSDDIGFVNQLMDSMLINLNADASRFYVTGFSMGSIMSHHLACNINHRIAAIGTMAGTMATSTIATCVPSYKTPVIHLHGTADPTVPYAGSALPTLSLVAQTINFWRNVHGCSTTTDSTRLANTGSDGNTITVDRFVYNSCNTTGPLELYRFNGAGHVYLYQPVNDITEAFEIWRFFYQWSKPDAPVATLKKTNYAKLNLYPNPAHDQISIDGLADQTVVSILNVDGKLIATQLVKSGVISIQELSKGIYFLRFENNKQIEQLKFIKE